MKTIRLDKYLSSQLGLSRAEAKKTIRAGRVRTEPPRAPAPELQIDPENDAVYLDGERLVYRAYLYLMLNKPAGVVSATEDRGKTVLDLVPPSLRRSGLFPAGRLDKDTTGLMLITDDGVFAHEILSPTRHVEKAYEVTAQRPLGEEARLSMLRGVCDRGEILRASALRLLRTEPAGPVYEIVLTQGRYHQIKRMFSACGSAVTALKRTRIGGLSLDPALAPGECRLLLPEETQALKQWANGGEKNTLLSDL